MFSVIINHTIFDMLIIIHIILYNYETYYNIIMKNEERIWLYGTCVDNSTLFIVKIQCDISIRR